MRNLSTQMPWMGCPFNLARSIAFRARAVAGVAVFLARVAELRECPQPVSPSVRVSQLACDGNLEDLTSFPVAGSMLVMVNKNFRAKVVPYRKFSRRGVVRRFSVGQAVHCPGFLPGRI